MASDTVVMAILDSRLKANWNATPIAWDNTNYKAERGVAYIEPKLSGIGSEPIGMNCTKKTYSYIIEVNVPKGGGDIVCTTLAEQLVDLFAGYIEGNLHCLKGYVQRVDMGKGWHQRNAVLEVKYKEYRGV